MHCHLFCELHFWELFRICRVNPVELVNSEECEFKGMQRKLGIPHLPLSCWVSSLSLDQQLHYPRIKWMLCFILYLFPVWERYKAVSGLLFAGSLPWIFAMLNFQIWVLRNPFLYLSDKTIYQICKWSCRHLKWIRGPKQGHLVWKC